MTFQVGQRIRHRETGKVATVTLIANACGNVYVGEGGEQYEISPVAWELVPDNAPTQDPAPIQAQRESVAAANGQSNGHIEISVERAREPVA